jgi:nicotinate-nucleotide--dimethylbenzimidazole phosphoribosyltransferase
MDTPRYANRELQTDKVSDRKVGRGTANLMREPAMSREECEKALEVGRNIVEELVSKGYGILATGEMGIGNTTPTSVLAALYLGLDAEDVTGKGAGLSDRGLARKREVIRESIERIQKLSLTDPVDILAQAGGYEIAAMAGMFLGGVKCHVPIVIDGAISAVAALAAYRIDERVQKIAIASHVSDEGTGAMALSALDLEAPIHARMCLGEGTGAMTLFPLIDMAFDVYEKMGAFTDYKIEPYERFEKAEKEE